MKAQSPRLGVLALLLAAACSACMSKNDATPQQSNYGITSATETSASAGRTPASNNVAPPVNCASGNQTSPSSPSLSQHVGAAFGAFQSYIYLPAKGGKFSGVAGGSATAKETGTRALAFIKAQIALAVLDLSGQPALCRAIGTELSEFAQDATVGLAGAESNGQQPNQLDNVLSTMNSITRTARSLGADIKPVANPVLT
jgi:hypothetical protein